MDSDSGWGVVVLGLRLHGAPLVELVILTMGGVVRVR